MLPSGFVHDTHEHCGAVCTDCGVSFQVLHDGLPQGIQECRLLHGCMQMCSADAEISEEKRIKGKDMLACSFAALKDRALWPE